MKIAVTAVGTELRSLVDRRFGRAQNFIVVDTETGACEVHDNKQNLEAAQGAGIQAGQKVASLGVEAIITGNVGPKAHATLQAAGIRIFLAPEGSVGDAVELFKKNGLQEADSANVEGHWV